MPTSLRHLLRPAIVTIIAIAGATFAESDVALAQTYTVNTGGDDFDGTCAPLNINTGTDCTLRDAIDDANSGADTIAFASYLSIISPASPLQQITQPVTINGTVAPPFPNPPTKLRIDGVSAGSANGLYATASLTVQNLIITRFAGSGIRFDAAGSVSGSFIGTDESGTPGLGNTAGNGGGIHVDTGTVTITNSTISGNRADVAGAGPGYGGGIYNNRSTITLTSSIVSGNTADAGAGIYSIGGSGDLTLTNSTVSGNTATYIGAGASSGGGIFNLSSATLTLINSTVSGNTADHGGGINNTHGSEVYLTNSTISGNDARVQGGGINNNIGGLGDPSPGYLTMINSTVSGNTAELHGGGILNQGFMTLTNSTFSGNTAKGNGAGIYHQEGTTDVDNATISNNTAGSDSSGSGRGGGIYRDEGAVNLKNTIVGGNSGYSGEHDCYGTLTSQGYNLVQTVSAGCNIAGDTTGNITGQDPLLAPLALNTPGTTQTHALMDGSPAANRGSPDCPPPPTDQRGVIRPQIGICDIGAYESSFASPTPSPAPTVSITPPATSTVTVTSTVTAPATATASTVPTVTPTATAPASATPTSSGATGTSVPTSTSTATAIPTVTPTPATITPSPTPAPPTQGDADCDGNVDQDDGLGILSDEADVGTPPCIGQTNVNCDGDIGPLDALLILAYAAGFLDPDVPPTCPAIGTPL